MLLNTPAQLSLPLYLPDNETFASFWPGKTLADRCDQGALSQQHGSYLYFWSREGGGRSHLLHAACAEMSARGEAVGYVPLDKRTWFVPEVLDGMEQLPLVCIDNIECIAGEEAWEMAILISITASWKPAIPGSLLPAIVPASAEPAFTRSGITARLGQIYRLQPLSDEDKLQALQLRAGLRGFELPEDVGRFY